MELIALECDRFHNIVKRNVVIACVLFPNLGRGNYFWVIGIKHRHITIGWLGNLLYLRFGRTIEVL